MKNIDIETLKTLLRLASGENKSKDMRNKFRKVCEKLGYAENEILELLRFADF